MQKDYKNYRAPKRGQCGRFSKRTLLQLVPESLYEHETTPIRPTQ